MCFFDKEKKPSTEDIYNVLGEKKPLWDKITGYIYENYGLTGELKYFGKKSGWSLWYKKSGKSLITLIPGKNTFNSMIVIGNSVAEAAFNTTLNKKIGNILESAHPYHDGRWLMINTETDEDVDDICRLLLLKSKPPKRLKTKQTEIK
jgi:hypothetical protein